MRLNGEKGQIAVFLSIILMVIVILVEILIDGSRIRSGETNVKRAVDSAARSALASYSSKLKNDYGIFALSMNDEDRLKETLKSYIEKNLMIDSAETKMFLKNDTRSISIYDFKVEDIKVTPIFNLSENEVVRNQILEYMKYRAPKEIVEGFWERLTAVKEASKMSGSYKKKIEVDKKLKGLGRNQEELMKSIFGDNGDSKSEAFYVNGFNSGNEWETKVKKFSSLIGEYKSLLFEFKSIENEIARLISAISVAIDKNSLKSLRSDLEAANLKKSEILEKTCKVKEDIGISFKMLYEEMTVKYVIPNKKAMNNVNEIIRMGAEAKKSVDELESSLEENFKDESDNIPNTTDDSSAKISGGFYNNMKSDADNLKSLIPDENEGTGLVKDLSRNIEFLNYIMETLNGINNRVNEMNENTLSDYNDLSAENVLNTLISGLGKYNNNIKYEYEKVKGNKEDTGLDSREKVKNQLKLDNNEEKDIDLKNEGVNFEELPSFKKILSKDFTLEDKRLPEIFLPLDISQKLMTGDIKYAGGLDNVQDKAEFNEDEKEGFSESAFGFLSSLGERISEGVVALRDEIYIDEYIMGTFKNSVPILRQGSSDKKDVDLSGNIKQLRQTFFESEVEYILYGNSSQNTNKTMAKSQILLIRFGLDTLHVYMDPQKKELALGVATALTGWWTAGAGVPIASNLIMCGWGMGEAIIDLNHLMNGESIPFFKLKGDWESNILPDKSGPKSKPALLFNYHDYLNLFLLFKDSNEKINRIEDLIQINLQKNNKEFKVGKYNTYIRLEVTVSMNYLFVTQAFMPKSMKTENGRHKFNVIIYQGY